MAEPVSKAVITLNLTSPEGQVQSVLDALRVPALSVRLKDITVTQGAPEGFRVFVNAKDAGPQTSIDDPAYVASVAFFPQPVVGKSAGSFVVDLTPALDRMAKQDLLAADAPLSLTLVPIGPEDARISVGEPELLK
ncbi:hypothetical protein [Antarctobacter sp.]|uniref:hypothetical protein n=1 Tax=Antarctobacter sp. TaxID=1872577 RepID=UPI002B268239|nr:hypothetical protein [Antarctobacter sp.]